MISRRENLSGTEDSITGVEEKERSIGDELVQNQRIKNDRSRRSISVATNLVQNGAQVPFLL